MIEIKDLHKSYKMGSSELHVLKGINFNIKEGELVAIMGSSGSGKSTLLNILGILDEADSGHYILDKMPVKNLNETIASKYDKLIGFHVVPPDYKLVVDKIKKGYNFIAFSFDAYFLGQTIREQLKELR